MQNRVDRFFNERSDGVIVHSGIKGQRWGFRRYQNPDGTLTEEGRARYAYKNKKQEYKYLRDKQKYEYKLAIARENAKSGKQQQKGVLGKVKTASAFLASIAAIGVSVSKIYSQSQSFRNFVNNKIINKIKNRKLKDIPKLTTLAK